MGIMNRSVDHDPHDVKSNLVGRGGVFLQLLCRMENVNNESLSIDHKRADALATLVGTLLTQHNLSARKLGERSGVSGSYVSMLRKGRDKRGKPTRPSPDVLRQLADGLSRDPVTDVVSAERSDGIFARLMAEMYPPRTPAGGAPVQPPESRGGTEHAAESDNEFSGNRREPKAQEGLDARQVDDDVDLAPQSRKELALAEIEVLLTKLPDVSIALTDLARGSHEWDAEDAEFVRNRLRRLAEQFGRSQAAC